MKCPKCGTWYGQAEQYRDNEREKGLAAAEARAKLLVEIIALLETEALLQAEQHSTKEAACLRKVANEIKERK